jgi:hypothetical protein
VHAGRDPDLDSDALAVADTIAESHAIADSGGHPRADAAPDARPDAGSHAKRHT